MTGNENPSRLEVEWPDRVRKTVDEVYEEEKTPWWAKFAGALIVLLFVVFLVLLLLVGIQNAWTSLTT